MNINVYRPTSTEQDNLEIMKLATAKRITEVATLLDAVPFNTGIRKPEDILFVAEALKEYANLTGTEYKIRERKIL